MAKRWIQAAHIQRGGLHKSLGVPQGEKIGMGKIKAAEKKAGKVGMQARLAATFAKMRGK